MSKPKKDWTALNIRMSSDIYDTLTQYADDKGQNKTVAVERILKEHLDMDETCEYCKSRNGIITKR